MKFVKSVLFVCLSAGFASCEKVIDVDLNTASPKYVIEGTIDNKSDKHWVVITQTKNFDENNNFAGVTGATVVIKDLSGGVDTLQPVMNGVYETRTIKGTPGHTYQLYVNVGGEVFTAQSYMPPVVKLDSLSLAKSEFASQSGVDILVVPHFTDPGGVRNYYRFAFYLNNIKSKSVIVRNDERFDGKATQQAFRGVDAEPLSGDSVEIQMQCIDEWVYKYFYSLEQTIGQNAATPANPVSNIAGGALGYFSAYTVDSKKIFIP